MFYELAALCCAKVPHCLDILVFCEVFGEMVTISSHNVDYSSRKIRSIEYLEIEKTSMLNIMIIKGGFREGTDGATAPFILERFLIKF
jgi:hypothetical protein